MTSFPSPADTPAIVAASVPIPIRAQGDGYLIVDAVRITGDLDTKIVRDRANERAAIPFVGWPVLGARPDHTPSLASRFRPTHIRYCNVGDQKRAQRERCVL